MSVGAPELDDLPLAEGSPQRPTGARRRRPLVAGGVAGAWAFLVGVALVTCLVLLVWVLSPHSSGDSAAAWRATGLTWLGLHLVPLQLGGSPVTLLPMGGLLLGLLLTRRGGLWTDRLLPDPSGGEVCGIVIGSSVVYGSGAALIAWLCSAPGATASPGRAFLVAAAVAAVGTLWGVGRAAGVLGWLRAWTSDALWRTVTAGLAATLGLLAAGAVLATASLLAQFGAVAGTLADLQAGVVGSAGVTLAGALALPNLAVWAMALLAGPGFEVGGAGGLSAFGGEVASLPALPVFAAIPTTAPAWAPVLLVVPVGLGVVAGRIRWGRDLPTLGGALTGGLGLAVVVAPLLAGLGVLSSGSLGQARLAQIGPVLWPFVIAATGLVVAGFLAEAGYQSARLSWDLHRAEQRAAALREGSGEESRVPGAGEATATDPVGPSDPEGSPDQAPAPAAEGAALDEGAGAPAGRRSRMRSRLGAGGAAVSTRVLGVGSAAVARVASLRPEPGGESAQEGGAGLPEELDAHAAAEGGTLPEAAPAQSPVLPDHSEAATGTPEPAPDEGATEARAGGLPAFAPAPGEGATEALEGAAPACGSSAYENPTEALEGAAPACGPAADEDPTEAPDSPPPGPVLASLDDDTAEIPVVAGTAPDPQPS